MYPVYKGTPERGDQEICSRLHFSTNTYQGAQLWIQMIKDVRRSLDYLETRPYIQMEKLAFYVYSWGGPVGTIAPAIENRLAANILCLFGLGKGGRAEIIPINYVRRVKIPTLLLNGKHDHLIDYETRAKPLFELLGPPKDQKHHVICDTDYIVQKNVVIQCLKGAGASEQLSQPSLPLPGILNLTYVRVSILPDVDGILLTNSDQHR